MTSQQNVSIDSNGCVYLESGVHHRCNKKRQTNFYCGRQYGDKHLLQRFCTVRCSSLENNVVKMAGNVAWNCEQDEILIDFVRNNEFIYNIKCKEYRNTQRKQQVWWENEKLVGYLLKQVGTYDKHND